MHDRSDVGQAIHTRRRDLRLTQDQLADLAGCSTRFVHALERGKPTLRIDKVLDVLEVLGLELAMRRGTGRWTVDA